MKQTLNTLHQSHKGISKNLAQTMFVQMASPLHKAHLYRMKLNKSQPKQSQGGALSTCNNAWMAIFRNGIQLFHVSSENSNRLSCLTLITFIERVNTRGLSGRRRVSSNTTRFQYNNYNIYITYLSSYFSVVYYSSCVMYSVTTHKVQRSI